MDYISEEVAGFCIYSLDLIIFIGAPAAIEYGGTSLFTTLFAPITEPSPIFTPGNIQHPRAIHTSLPIFIGEEVLIAHRLSSLHTMVSVPYRNEFSNYGIVPRGYHSQGMRSRHWQQVQI